MFYSEVKKKRPRLKKRGSEYDRKFQIEAGRLRVRQKELSEMFFYSDVKRFKGKNKKSN